MKLLGADLADQAETSRIFLEVRPSIVVHCAAATVWTGARSIPTKPAESTWRCRQQSPRCRSRRDLRLLYISTDSVFDGGRGNYAETDTPSPVNVYAKTKLQGEREVLRQNPAALIARVSLYGWNAQKKRAWRNG